MIKIENVKRVYSGKTGCMCGCKGKYFENEKMIKKVIGILDASPNTDFSTSDEYVDVVIDGRLYVAYFKEEVK